MIKTNWLKIWACMLMFVFAAGAISLPTGALAQAGTSAPVKKKNFAQRHPNATGIVAGVAAYKIAKKTGKNRDRAGRKKNFAQRHPMMTGLATGVAARKLAKDTGKNKK